MARLPRAPMIDLVLLGLVLAASTEAGLLLLRALRALPTCASERLLAELGAGRGVAGVIGLGLAAMGLLRAAPVGLLGAAAHPAGRCHLAHAVDALNWRTLRRAWS